MPTPTPPEETNQQDLAVKPDATISFTDVTARFGVDFHHNRDDAPFNIGGGAAAGDYDNDGLLDIYVTNSRGDNALYRNNGHGTFTDVATDAGVDDPTGRGNGAGWGDYDNDGDLDLFVANFGSSQLFRSNGDGSFTDATAEAGVGDPDGEYRTMTPTSRTVGPAGGSPTFTLGASNSALFRAGPTVTSFCSDQCFTGSLPSSFSEDSHFTLTITVPASAAARTHTFSVQAKGNYTCGFKTCTHTVTKNGTITKLAGLDLRASISSGSPNPQIPGGNITVTASVRNLDHHVFGDTATGVVMTITNFNGLIVVSAPGCGVSGAFINCNQGNVARLTTESRTITFRIPQGAGANQLFFLRNHVTSSTPLRTIGDDFVDISFRTATANMSISKTDSPDPILAGTRLNYVLTLRHLGGPENATNVVVKDTLPAEVTFDTATTSQGSCSAVGQVVTCNLGSVGINGTVIIQIGVIVSPLTVGTITNNANVSADQADGVPGDNSASADTLIVNHDKDLKGLLNALEAKLDNQTPVNVDLGPIEGKLDDLDLSPWTTWTWRSPAGPRLET